MIKIVENSKLLRIIYPIARLTGGITNLRGGAFGETIHLWGRIKDMPERTLWHEACHVCQYKRHGKLKFLYHHVVDWAKARISGKSAFESYRSIRWESEAYLHEDPYSIVKIYPEYTAMIKDLEGQTWEVYNGTTSY